MQKILEAFNKHENVLSLAFDIQAAFDAVWHKGLILKMQKLKVPEYIIRWTKFFLADRTFEVRVGDAISERAPIITGVPQGSSISPILFSIFINDIPMRSASNDGYSLLFADDLTVFFLFKNVKLNNETVSGRALRATSWKSNSGFVNGE